MYDLDRLGFPAKSAMSPLHELAQAGAVGQSEPVPVRNLYYHNTCVIDWPEEKDQLGQNWRSIYPAWHQDKMCWLIRDEWEPEYGYSGYKIDEHIIEYYGGLAVIRAVRMINY